MITFLLWFLVLFILYKTRAPLRYWVIFVLGTLMAIIHDQNKK